MIDDALGGEVLTFITDFEKTLDFTELQKLAVKLNLFLVK